MTVSETMRYFRITSYTEAIPPSCETPSTPKLNQIAIAQDIHLSEASTFFETRLRRGGSSAEAPQPTRKFRTRSQPLEALPPSIDAFGKTHAPRPQLGEHLPVKLCRRPDPWTASKSEKASPVFQTSLVDSLAQTWQRTGLRNDAGNTQIYDDLSKLTGSWFSHHPSGQLEEPRSFSTLPSALLSFSPRPLVNPAFPKSSFSFSQHQAGTKNSGTITRNRAETFDWNPPSALLARLAPERKSRARRKRAKHRPGSRFWRVVLQLCRFLTFPVLTLFAVGQKLLLRGSKRDAPRP